MDGAAHPTTPTSHAGPSHQNGSVPRPIKKTRQTQSCDACRRRKVRCDRSIDSDSPCSNCRMIDETCAFTRPQKKRGPAERLGGTPRSRSSASRAHTPAPPPATAIQGVAAPAAPPRQPPPPPPPLQPQHPLNAETTWWNALGSIPKQPDLQELHAGPVEHRTEQHLRPPHSESTIDQPPTLADRSDRLLPDTPSSPYPSQGYPTFLHNPANVLDNVLPRGLLYLLIDHFFDYIYPLNPVIHRPTFLKDVLDHREERPGEEEWITVVMVVVCLTIIQLPPTFIPVSVEEARRIAMTCFRYAKGFHSTDYHKLSLNRQTSQLLLGTCTSFLGFKEQAAAGRLAIVGSLNILRLHEEFSFAAYSPIEREMRRRIFWISFGGDQTLALMQAAPCCFHVDEVDTALPPMIDDEFLSDSGQHVQPPDHSPIMAGFYYISKLFRYAAHVLECRRRDRRQAPDGEGLYQRLAQVEGLFHRISSLMDDCPSFLRLGPARSPESERGLQSSLEGFYRSGSKMSPARDAFLVQKANIYVTQQTYRYLTLDYLKQLYALHDIAKDPTRSRPDNFYEYSRTVTATCDHVAEDLLNVLHSLPIEAIAVNSLPIVIKVRYVACNLLDAEDTSNFTSPAAAENHSSPHAKRAETALLDFVDILAKLDKLNRITEGW